MHFPREVKPMNTVHNDQEKRSIKVKDFLQDFYGGMMDGDLLAKYRLTPTGLEKFYTMLQEKGILYPEEISARYAQIASQERPSDDGDVENSSFICPSCLASHATMFDICPNCGVSFHDLMGREERSDESVWKADTAQDFGAAVPDDPGHWPSDSNFSSVEPIEIPEAPLSETDFFTEPFDRDLGDEFVAEDESEFPDVPRDAFEVGSAEAFSNKRSHVSPANAFDRSLDDLNPGIGREDDRGESRVAASSHGGVHCQTCQDEMEPALRDIYDQRRSRLSLMVSGAFLVLVFLGSASLSFFDGYSLGRLFVVYLTGMFLLFGGILAAVGTFMFLAREKVYYCPGCRRIYPRG